MIACSLAIAPGAGAAAPYGEPLDLPGTTYPADPAVIRADGVYYLYPTSSGRNVECWSSTDLDTWDYEGVVWEPADPGGWNASLVWAPDVLPYEGRFYLYYTANRMLGVAVADSPTGPFADVYDRPLAGGGYGETGIYTIDAHVHVAQDGLLYLYATAYVPLSVIRVIPLADPVTLAPPWRLALAPDGLGWEGASLEGPWVVYRGGLYYLMYSGNLFTRVDYAIGYATSTNPLGPFRKYGGNPILATDMNHEFWGPGHHAVVTGGDGTMHIFYHTKIAPEEDWRRVIRRNELAVNDYGEMRVVLDDDDDDHPADGEFPDDDAPSWPGGGDGFEDTAEDDGEASRGSDGCGD